MRNISDRLQKEKWKLEKGDQLFLDNYIFGFRYVPDSLIFVGCEQTNTGWRRMNC